MTKRQIENFSVYVNQAIKILPGSIYFKDVNGFYLGCNDFQAKMGGFDDPQEMIGKTDYDLPWKDYADAIRDTDKRIMRNKIPEEVIEHGIRYDGSEVILLTNKAPLYDSFDQVIGIVGTSIDITERRKAEIREQEALKLITLERKKQQSLKMQGGAIAHEMRTPLSAIQFVARGLQQKLKPIVEVEAHDGAEAEGLPRLSEKDRRFLARAPEELTYISKSAMNVIDMLLVNLQNPSAEVATEILSIRSCVESALEEYALSDEERHLITAAMLDDFQIKANGRLLKHVFFNLLKNALHYIKDVPEGRIEIWTTVDKAEHTLHFRDTGKGIAKKSLPHIFDHFYSRTDHGTGLGLAFCKMTMKSLGGDITCRSVEGQFTHFILTFPLIREDQIKASADSETAR